MWLLGLAQAAVHSPLVAALVADADEPVTGSKSTKEVAFAVAADTELDGKVLREDEPKMRALLSRGGGSIVRAHAAQWACPLDKVYEKAHELQQLAVAVMAGPVRPDKIAFDFFLYSSSTGASSSLC